ncbi:5-formyltetrahydrofolate cyclo-ligase [Streptomyces sp. TRM 70351]|uniref:5-formyltetrahydrofolate cyclo-ligase n=1 Tax=Streptomyces sp. TRM 70351 TaxID=3116552 RepID=UPI002E7B05A9|nr:5-formyltetrahydrofolate cyclo-ligase [Streptomyces sp. TRM 70351]MEE1929493.1 5-formyltetrahydrofolate cyclo-ligase [Streptomyces sp. TRM 70351]
MRAATGGPQEGVAAGKRALRRDLLSRRARLAEDAAREAAAALTRRALALPELADAGTVAAYVPVGREPGARALLDALRERGTRVLLPVLLPDDDLDWAPYGGAGHLRAAGRGLWEPDGERLGPDAVTEAGTVLLPGLAVDVTGLRLGRGGGSYDRVLARLAAFGAHPALVVLLYDHELLTSVPAEPHDRPVHAAVTPSGVTRFPAGRPAG